MDSGCLKLASPDTPFGRATECSDGYDMAISSLSSTEVIDALSAMVAARLFDEFSEVATSGHYTRNLARGLEDNRKVIDTIVAERISSDIYLRNLRWIPFFDPMLRAVSHLLQRVLVDLLGDPRLDELIRSLIRENLDQVGERVHRRASTDRADEIRRVIAMLDEARALTEFARSKGGDLFTTVRSTAKRYTGLGSDDKQD